MKFDIVREESYSIDFMEDNMDNITCVLCRDIRDEKFNEIKGFYQSTFKNGLITGNVRQSSRLCWKYEVSDFWEGFAEFILQEDFIIFNYSDIPPSVNKEIEKLSTGYLDVSSECREEAFNVLLEILKRKYKIKNKSGKDESFGRSYNGVKEENGVKFYVLTFNKFDGVRNILTELHLPKDEIDKTEAMAKLNRLNLSRKESGLTVSNIDILSEWFLEGLLAPDEKDEYQRRCLEIRESIELKFKMTEWKIKIAEEICNSYKPILDKNNIILSPEELQLLKECLSDFIPYEPALDLFGIKKPTTSFSFSKPFYFIEVKSVSKKSSGINLNRSQKSFIEDVKSRFGILILHIRVEPHEIIVRYLSPK
jgi:hypothetical protein